ncbi:RHS repeat-associated core domain-containing protein [Sphingomonas sp. S2-65]|uniref:RHS repeat-associated core domain-containing protein n=1 Tax=Sphingomonas sp. S2-65 TaxID=2903960 RepID=UPI001F4798C0|nr:DUF4123 domain-containing protein [Sphingomonas sp. S2-65]UYY57228.1 DUF4123 domain-containing protein [Sphingomonas sp. S2-65]
MTSGPPPAILFADVAAVDVAGWAAAGQLYALVDGCVSPDIPAMAEVSAPERAACLYLGRAAINYREKAPYLFRINAAQAQALAMRFDGQPWGVFLISGAGFDGTRRHLRRFLRVRSPEGDGWLFRFYDPRLLPAFLRSSTPDELNAFMGPVQAFLTVDKGGDGVIAYRAPEIVRAAPRPAVGARHRISTANVAAFRRRAMGDRLAATFNGTPQRAHRDPKSDDLLVTNPDGGTMRLGFGGDGQLDRVISPLGRQWHLRATERGKPVGMRLPSGLELGLAYDGTDDLASVSRGGRERFRTQHDVQHRLTRVDFPDGSWAGTQYRDTGIDAARDTRGRFITAERDRVGRVERFEYDGDTLAAVVDGNGNATRFRYGAGDRPEAQVHADGSREQYVFDPAGRVQQITRTDGHVLDVAQNGAGQVTRLATPDGEVATFAYDDAGRLVAARNGDAALAWRYDAAGRLVEERQGDHLVAYLYDDAGTLTGITYPSGDTIRYTRDADMRLSSITDWAGRRHVIDYAPEDAGWRMTAPEGVSTTAWQNPVGLTTAVRVEAAGAPVFEQGFGYDDDDRLCEQRDTRVGATRYGYDAEGQLLRVERSAGADEAFGYDGAGNRIAGPAGPAQFDALNRMVEQGAERFAYDARGNLVERSGGVRAWRYAYDGFDRMVRAEDGAGLVLRFGYDPLGRRIWKEVLRGGEQRITRYVWAGEQLIRDVEQVHGGTGAEWTAGAAARTRDYGYWPQQYTPLFLRQDGAVFNYHNDPAGTPMRLTDPAGRVVWEAERAGFGGLRVLLSVIDQPLRMPGQYCDAETGLHYNRFRYYDPALGRYLTRDPIGIAGGLNLYAYVGNDPINRADPTGLWWKMAAAIAGAVVAAVAVVALAPLAAPLLIVAAGAAAGAAFFGLNEALNQETFCGSCILLAMLKGAVVGAVAAIPAAFVPLAAGVGLYALGGAASGFVGYAGELAWDNLTGNPRPWSWPDAAAATGIGAVTAGAGRYLGIRYGGRPASGAAGAAAPDGASPVASHADDGLGAPHNTTPDVPERPATGPGSAGHKAERWQDYQDRGGEWDYDRWAKTYDRNMQQARLANQAVDDYHSKLGWGQREVSIDANVDGVDHVRRLDIADKETLRGVEYKTGYQTANQDNLWEVARDKALIDKEGWDIEWVFRDKPSQPLLDALDDAGIPYKLGK